MIGETTFTATARFEGGGSSIKVTARTPYGKRELSVSADVTDEKLLASIRRTFEAAIESARGELGQTAMKETARAIVAAANVDEVI